MDVLYDPQLFRTYANEVDLLLKRLEKRKYRYPTQKNKGINNSKAKNQIPPEVEPVKESNDLPPLPVTDVLHTFQLYRSLKNRTHAKNVQLGKMMYRSEGWIWKGSIFQYEEEPALEWIVGEERMTIDKLEDQGVFHSKKRKKKGKSSVSPKPFLTRNIKSTQNSYKDKVFTSIHYKGIELNHLEDFSEKILPKKRKNPPRRKGRPRKKSKN